MASEEYNYIEIENKWQKEWYKEKIYESKKTNNKKFFIHFAYPGVSGYLHVGHMRGFTYCDIIARYKRMTGHDVLFPAGFHASGIPSIGFAKKIERKDPRTINILKEYGLNKDEIEKLKNPNEVVNYFSKVYVNDYWKKFGYLIDYSRIMSTISKGYKQFIKWQFKKLNENDLLIKKPHYAPFCPNCGPVAVDKSETDISKGGNAEIQEFTVIKFKMDDGKILPAATLRPETIYGVTNMWINPKITYELAEVEGELWIVSKEALEKLSHQIDKIKPLNKKIKGERLIGKTCKVPIIERKVPLLPGPFANPNVATGIVMSVPAHAPYDYIALKELQTDIEPITIIDVKDFGTNPAKEMTERLNIKNQKEAEKLETATEEVYKKEFHTGKLNKKCGKFSGIKISEIKDQVKDELIKNNQATIMREFSEEVVCRCAKKVIIKKIPDQWFVKYSDKNLTENTKEHVKKMEIFPEEYKKELPGVLDWFDDRACIRKGSWLGTEFPFKKGWIVEPISDSTLYPAYYVISKYVNQQEIKTEDMTEKFFDYVFLGKGESKLPIWKQIREDFEYWYPVNINLGGKEHKTVHFPVFLMNHVAVLPSSKRPKGIFVHWWVTQKGKEKISKSKGGAEHIAEAATKYGVDAMRLYYAHVGSTFVDIEWDSEKVIKYKNRLANIYKQIDRIKKIKDKKDENLDLWLKSKINNTIKKTKDAFKKYDLRVATNDIFFDCNKNLQWYLKRGGGNKDILGDFIKKWIKLMTPITPHLSEELWSESKDSFISNEKYPNFSNEQVYPEQENGEYLLSETIKDISEILKVTSIKPKKICIYTSQSWKQDIYKKAIKMSEENKLNIGILMKEIMSDPDLKKKGKEISKFVKKLPQEIMKLNKTDKKRYLVEISEKKYLKDSEKYIQDFFECDIEIYNSEEKEIYDPENKSRFAQPLRPAIYVE